MLHNSHDNNEGLLRRIRRILAGRNQNIAALEEFMYGMGRGFPIAYLDALAEPSDVYEIAKFLGVNASLLFEVTNHFDHYERAVFKEMWRNYSSKASVGDNEAWKRVVLTREARGERTHAGIRTGVRQALESLTSKRVVSIGCSYPDCDCESTLHCGVTGWMLGPEG